MCISMNCPPGTFATKEGAENDTDGCSTCPVGSYSEGVDVIACLAMACPAGQIASMAGATTDAEGCVDCAAGKYSPGGNLVQCIDMNCPAGKQSSKLGSATETDGCTQCEVGTYSTGDDTVECSKQICPFAYQPFIKGARTETDGCEIPGKTIVIIILVSLVLVSISAFVFGYFSAISGEDKYLDDSVLDMTNAADQIDTEADQINQLDLSRINAKDDMNNTKEDRELLNNLDQTNFIKMGKKHNINDTGIKDKYKMKADEFDGSVYNLDGSQVDKNDSFVLNDDEEQDPNDLKNDRMFESHDRT